MKLLPKDAKHEELFVLYDEFLKKIKKNNNLEISLRHFELDLLDMLGYGFDYDSEIDSNEPIEAAKMDGASEWEITRYIRLPMIRSLLFLVLITFY